MPRVVWVQPFMVWATVELRLVTAHEAEGARSVPHPSRQTAQTSAKQPKLTRDETPGFIGFLADSAGLAGERDRLYMADVGGSSPSAPTRCGNNNVVI